MIHVMLILMSTSQTCEHVIENVIEHVIEHVVENRTIVIIENCTTTNPLSSHMGLECRLRGSNVHWVLFLYGCFFVWVLVHLRQGYSAQLRWISIFIGCLFSMGTGYADYMYMVHIQMWNCFNLTMVVLIFVLKYRSTNKLMIIYIQVVQSFPLMQNLLCRWMPIAFLVYSIHRAITVYCILYPLCHHHRLRKTFIG